MDFDSAAATWDDDEQRARRTRAIAEEIRARLGDRGHHRGLEFGAGTGTLSLLLADRFDEVVLVDTSAPMLAMAAGKAAAAGPALAARVRTLAVDLLAADVDVAEPGSVDVVYSSMALHHVGDVDALLRRFHGLLAPDGLLLGADLARDGDGSYHAHDEAFEGHHGFAPDELVARLSSAGFRTAEITTVFVVRKEDDRGAPRDYPVFLAVARRMP